MGTNEQTRRRALRALAWVRPDLAESGRFFDVDEEDVVEALADLLALAYHCTNDDGNGLTPELTTEEATNRFRYEEENGDPECVHCGAVLVKGPDGRWNDDPLTECSWVHSDGHRRYMGFHTPTWGEW